MGFGLANWMVGAAIVCFCAALPGTAEAGRSFTVRNAKGALLKRLAGQKASGVRPTVKVKSSKAVRNRPGRVVVTAAKKNQIVEHPTLGRLIANHSWRNAQGSKSLAKVTVEENTKTLDGSPERLVTTSETFPVESNEIAGGSDFFLDSLSRRSIKKSVNQKNTLAIAEAFADKHGLIFVQRRQSLRFFDPATVQASWQLRARGLNHRAEDAGWNVGPAYIDLKVEGARFSIEAFGQQRIGESHSLTSKLAKELRAILQRTFSVPVDLQRL